MSQDQTKTLAPRRRVARGPKRPVYLHSVEMDKFMFIVTALMSEVSTLQDRQDTCEALAEAGLPATTANIEAFELTADRAAARELRRDGMLKRVFRVVMEELDEAREHAETPDLAAVVDPA